LTRFNKLCLTSSNPTVLAKLEVLGEEHDKLLKQELKKTSVDNSMVENKLYKHDID